MKLESSIVPGAGSFRIKLILALATGTIAFIISRLTGWRFGFVWYAAATLTVLAGLAVWAVVELWIDYGRGRN